MAQSKEVIHIHVKPDNDLQTLITPADPMYPTMMILFEDDSEDSWGANTATH